MKTDGKVVESVSGWSDFVIPIQVFSRNDGPVSRGF